MKKLWKKSISVLMIIVMLLGLAADLRFGAVEALAAAQSYNAVINNDKSYLIVNGEAYDETTNYIVDYNQGEGYPFSVYVEWYLPNAQSAKAGDTITVTLPDSVIYQGVTNGTMQAGTNIEHFTLTDNVLTIVLENDLASDSTGQIRLNGTLKNNGSSSIEDGVYKFSIFQKDISLQVTNATKQSSLSVSKRATGSYQADTGYDYVIEVHSAGTNTGIVLNDIFSTDMELTGDVTVSSSLAGRNVSGVLSRSSETGFIYTVDPDYEMADGEILTFQYSAKLPDEIYNTFNGWQPIQNDAVAVSDKNADGVRATSYNGISRSLLTKNARLSDDGKTVEWTIRVNDSTYPVDISGAELSDILPSDYEIISDVIMTSSGNETVQIPSDGRNIFYTFPEGSTDTYVIRFTTSVDTGGIPVSTGGTTSDNKAQMTVGDTVYQSNGASVTIPGIGNFHEKEAVSYHTDVIDGKEVGVIHWTNTITVPDPAICPLEDFVFYDNGASYQQVYQTLREGSLSVVYNGRKVELSDYSFSMLGNADTFQIDFGDYFAEARENDTIVISYDTYFDLISYAADIYNYSRINLNNRTVSQAEDSYKFVPLVSKSILETRNDSSDPYGINKIFRWCVKIDLSNYDTLPDTLLFRDILPENQTLVPGSAELWDSMWWTAQPYAVTGISEADGIVEAAIDKDVLMSHKESYGNYTYLHYQTTFADLREFLTGGTKTYSNTIEIYDNVSKECIDRASSVTAEITPPENKAVDKQLLSYGEFSGGYADYAIDVNAAGIKYLEEENGTLTLTDTLGNALEYVTGSLRVYTDSARQNELDKDLYTLAYENKQLILTLPDAQHCYVTYTVKVVAEGSTFSDNPNDPDYAGNDVKLEGTGTNTISDSVKLQGAVYKVAGNIVSNSATITLYKSDIDNFARGLKNAKYSARVVAIWEDGTYVEATDEILETRNITKVIEKETDEDGWLSFSGLHYDFLYEITETQAPEGYQINNEPVYVYFVGHDNSDYVSSLENVEPYKDREIIEITRVNPDSVEDLYYEMQVQDKKLPKELTTYIEISKQAAFGSAGELAGAVLRLTNSADNEVLAEWTTGSQSRKFYICEDGMDKDAYDEILLEPGVEYTLTELSAPSGYDIAAPVRFSVDNNGNIIGSGLYVTTDNNISTLVLKDNRAVYIHKTDSDGNALSGARLGIYDGSALITEFDTGTAYKLPVTADGSSGTIMAGKNYTLKEIVTPTGYKTIQDITFNVSDTGVITAAGGDGEVAVNGFTLTVTDKTYVTLKIVKQDTNHNPLSGAKFQIENPDGTLAKNGTFVTDSAGEARIEELTYGDYVIVEKTAPAGYEMISEKTPVTIGGTANNSLVIENGVAVKTITNSRILNEKGNIRITKTDGNAAVLAGAVFTLTDASGTDTAPYNATAITDDNGVAEFLNVPYGTYLLTETTAPYGYAFTASDEYVSGNGYGILNSVRGSASCTVTLDAAHTQSDYTNTNTFELSAVNTQLLGSLSFRKTDENDNPVGGAEFTLTSQKDSSVYTAVSDGNGDVTFSNLPFGMYTLTETTVPKYYVGWSKAADRIQVSIQSENAVTLPEITNTLLNVAIDKRAVGADTTLSGALLGIYDETDTLYAQPMLTWQTQTAAEVFYLGDATTEKNGVSYIAPGTYVLHEITAPNGYKTAEDIVFTVNYDDTARTASISSSGSMDNGVLVMRDEPVGTLHLLKMDSKFETDGSHKPLDGAVFKLYRILEDGSREQITDGAKTGYVGSDGNTYDDVYVTENGEINVSGLSYGTYVFQEVCAPLDYIITNEYTTFVLASGQEEQTVYNTEKVDRRGTIYLMKTDYDTAEPLKDARFDLYRIDSAGNYEFVAGNTTDENGQITFENIPYGNYTVIETGFPKDYMENSFQRYVTLDETTAVGTSIVDGQITGGSISVSVENKKKTRSFYVKKTGSDTGNTGLSGAEFALYSDAACSQKIYPADGNVTTDNNGIAVFPDIPYGTYYLKETAAPEGYEITQTEPVKIVLDDDTAGLYVENAPLIVTDDRIILHVNKFITGTDTVVKGAELTVFNDTDGFCRVWNTADIADFVMYLAADNTSAAAMNNTGTGNYIYPGTFTLKETGVPDGYLQAVEVTFTVSDDGRMTFYGTAPDKSKSEITDDRRLILYDEPCGSVTITKKDAENDSLLLNNAEFSIYRASDVSAITDANDAGLAGITPVAVKQTGEDGIKGTLSFEKLPLGTYAVFETSVPDGYLRVSQKYIVDITAAGQEIVLPVTNIHEAAAGNIKLTKTSRDGTTALSGAVFKLVNVNDETVEVATGQTDSNGEVTFTNVPFGTYKIIEVTPPAGYSVSLKDAATHTGNDYAVDVDNGNCITVYLTKDNCVGGDEANGIPGTLPVEVTDDILRGNLEVFKIDSKSGVGLSGVGFSLMNSKGEYFNKSGSLDAVFNEDEHIFTTDIYGILTITDIPFGTYTLEEKSTPANYVPVVNTEAAKHTVIIDKDNRQPNTATAVTVTNDVLTADFTIRKIETGTDTTLQDSDAGLEGAVYNLYSDIDLKNLVSTGITGEDGRYTFEGLAYGTYYLKEISAPANYMVDPDAIPVIIPDNISTVVPASQDMNVADDIGKGSLVIEKRDNDNPDILLSGATFELFGLNADKTQGTLIDTKTTGADGKAAFDNLDYGYYMVKETGVPAYYMAVTETADSIPVTENSVDENGEATQVIYNQNILFQISKRAANTIVDLDGAALGIFADGTTDFETTKPLVQWVTSATDPKKIYLGSTSGIVSDRAYITPGTYILAEIEAPEGYLKANPIRFTVDADGTVTLDDAGIVSAGDTSQRTPGVLLNSDNNLNSKNALLVMYDDEDVTKSIAVSKKAVNETVELPKAALKIVDAANQKEKISWTTTSEPRIISVGTGKVLQYETDYLLVEETAPQGYKLAESIPFYIKRDGSVVIGSVRDGEVSSASGEVTATAEGISLLTMWDKIGDGKIFISKRAAAGTAELEGASLEVVDKETGDVIADWTSGGAEHEIAIGITATTLQTGKTYILQETAAPDGYEIAEPIEFKINSDETIRLTQDTQAGFLSADGKTLTMIDDYSHAQINISKRASDGTEELPDAWLEVYDGAGTLVDRWKTSTQAYHVTVGNSDTDILKPDVVYTLHEEKAPKGYLTAQDIKFRVDGKGVITLENPENGIVLTDSSVQTLVMQDARRESAVITIRKMAEGRTDGLEGAQFVIYSDDAERTVVEQWTSGKIGHDITVGVNGKLRFSTTYVLHEETAPQGYAVAEDIRFSVDADGQIITLAETSDDGTVLIVRDAELDNTVSLSKKAVDGTRELNGSRLSVLDETGARVVTWTSADAAYKITFGEDGLLKPGKIYTMHEEAAPDGYLLAEDILFTVNSDGVISVMDGGEVSSDGRMLIMRDAVKPTADAFSSEDGPPKTGDNTPVALLVILLAAALFVIAGLVITGKRNPSEEEDGQQDMEDEN